MNIVAVALVFSFYPNLCFPFYTHSLSPSPIHTRLQGVIQDSWLLSGLQLLSAAGGTGDSNVDPQIAQLLVHKVGLYDGAMFYPLEGAHRLVQSFAYSLLLLALPIFPFGLMLHLFISLYYFISY